MGDVASEQLRWVGRKTRRCLVVLVVGLAATCSWGCGSGGTASGGTTGSSSPASGGAGGGGGDAVATVGGVVISKASLEHWLPVEAVISWRTLPLEHSPLGVLPDPPKYSECIEWLGSPAAPGDGRLVSVADRKTRCQQLLDELTKKTLEFLITYQWYKGESEARHLAITEAEVRSNLSRFIHEELPTPGDYEKYLFSTGMSEADELFARRRETYWEKVKAAILAQPHLDEVPRALAQFTSKWVAKTSCLPAYVIPGCSQYHGPLPPP